MLHDQELSTSLWEGATGTSMYIHNITQHAILDEKTAEEVFTSEKPNISHLSMFFRSPIYIHIPK